MENLAPNIIRQRLLIEGFYTIDVDENAIRDYFKKITKSLNLRMYGKPIIFSPEGLGKERNQGYDAFIPLIDSGISIYIFSNTKFFSIIIYACKNFNEKIAIETTKKFFDSNRVEHFSF